MLKFLFGIFRKIFPGKGNTVYSEPEEFCKKANFNGGSDESNDSPDEFNNSLDNLENEGGPCR